MSYAAPLKEMLFVVRELAGLAALRKLPGFEEATDDTVEAVLAESARFNAEVVAPLNRGGRRRAGDGRGRRRHDLAGIQGGVQAFRRVRLAGHPASGRGRRPGAAETDRDAVCIEMLNSANLSFALCPLLTDGAIEALLTAGSPEQQQTYMPKMISGRWTGTMNLTEPQAGSDLAAGAHQGRAPG